MLNWAQVIAGAGCLTVSLAQSVGVAGRGWTAEHRCEDVRGTGQSRTA